MKFGVITYARTKNVNIGDNMMSLGIRAIYKKMGIKDEDIVNIYFGQNVEKDYLYDLLHYEGDYVILPMALSMDFDSIRQDIFPLSEKIIPVFMGFHCVSRDGFVKYLHLYQHLGPFACRDMQTMRTVRQEGLDAYMIGCLSIQSVERRDDNLVSPEKVYLVNVPAKLKEYIPKNMLKDVVEKTHSIEFDDNLTGTQAAELDLKMAREILEEYRSNAKLVVTSRLHCALPCISMGIPTIVVRHEWKSRKELLAFDCRFDGMDKIMNIYNFNNFDKIDWNPPKPNIEKLKKKQLKQAIKMIQDIYEKYSSLCEISDFFENRMPSVYFTGAPLGYLSRKQKEDFCIRKTEYENLFELMINRHLYDTHLIIYGAGDKGKWMYSKFKNEIHMAKSCIYVDNDEKKHHKKLNQIRILPPYVISKYPENGYVVIIAANHSYDKPSQEIAFELNEKYGLIEGKNFFMLDKIIQSTAIPLSPISMVRPFWEEKIWD